MLANWDNIDSVLKEFETNQNNREQNYALLLLCCREDPERFYQCLSLHSYDTVRLLFMTARRNIVRFQCDKTQKKQFFY